MKFRGCSKKTFQTASFIETLPYYLLKYIQKPYQFPKKTIKQLFVSFVHTIVK